MEDKIVNDEFDHWKETKLRGNNFSTPLRKKAYIIPQLLLFLEENEYLKFSQIETLYHNLMMTIEHLGEIKQGEK